MKLVQELFLSGASLLLSPRNIVGNTVYHTHGSEAFHNRHWLLNEFHKLRDQDNMLRVWEVGCGNGSNVLPLLKAFGSGSTQHRQQNEVNTRLVMYASDLSSAALTLAQRRLESEWPTDAARRCVFFKHDLRQPLDAWLDNVPVALGSLDAAILTFTLGALSPTDSAMALKGIALRLRPGVGQLFIRDRARLDMAQLRLRKEQCLAPNYYQ